MSKTGETFFTSVGCIDGRVQSPLRIFGNKKFGAEYPDTITEAGLAGIFVKPISKGFLADLKKKLDISINLHRSKGILVHGHQECAGHPVSDIQHKKDILKAARIIHNLVSKKVKVLPVFVKRSHLGWVVEEL